jgi:hypothetical protein
MLIDILMSSFLARKPILGVLRVLIELKFTNGKGERRYKREIGDYILSLC